MGCAWGNKCSVAAKEMVHGGAGHNERENRKGFEFIQSILDFTI